MTTMLRWLFLLVIGHAASSYQVWEHLSAANGTNNESPRKREENRTIAEEEQGRMAFDYGAFVEDKRDDISAHTKLLHQARTFNQRMLKSLEQAIQRKPKLSSEQANQALNHILKVIPLLNSTHKPPECSVQSAKRAESEEVRTKHAKHDGRVSAHRVIKLLLETNNALLLEQQMALARPLQKLHSFITSLEDASLHTSEETLQSMQRQFETLSADTAAMTMQESRGWLAQCIERLLMADPGQEERLQRFLLEQVIWPAELAAWQSRLDMLHRGQRARHALFLPASSAASTPSSHEKPFKLHHNSHSSPINPISKMGSRHPLKRITEEDDMQGKQSSRMIVHFEEESLQSWTSAKVFDVSFKA